MSEAGPTPGEPFEFRPDPEAPGWYVGSAAESGLFIEILGTIRMCVEAPCIARVRLVPEPRHRNVKGSAHGGYIMGVVDQVLFLGPMMLGIPNVLGAVTIDATTQFLGPLAIGTPFDVLVEVLSETRRMIFLRGVFEQDGVRIAAFSGTIRKASAA